MSQTDLFIDGAILGGVLIILLLYWGYKDQQADGKSAEDDESL